MSNIFIIAEIGINHNGDMSITRQLIDMAASVGCDAVKFQKRNIEKVYTREYLAGKRESPWGTTQRDQKRGLELSSLQYDEIDEYCKKIGIKWSASAWDVDSQLFLRKYDLSFNKVASAMITHKNLLTEIASEGKQTYISTGMSTYEDIDRAVKIFTEMDCPFTLLHAVSTYPCNDADCNIRMIHALRERYGCEVGYSGHERGITPSLVAATLGATAIERHVTLDRTMYGSDQSASLEKDGIQRLVRDARNISKILGSGEKIILPDENECATKLRYFNREDFSW
jgi:N-acetylneuraminate synthase